MASRNKKAFFISLALHGLLISTLLWVIRCPPVRTVPRLVEVSLIPTRERMTRGNGIRVSRGSTGESHPVGTKIKNRLGKDLPGIPVLGLVPRTASGTGRMKGASDELGGEREIPRGGIYDGYHTATRMDVIDESKKYPFFDGLWAQINGQLRYPEILAKQHLEGQVRLQIGVDRRGVFDGRVIEIESSEPLLKAYALPAVIHALKNPLPPDRWLNEVRTIVVVDIDFKTIAPGMMADLTPEERGDRHFKNLMHFARTSSIDPKMTQKFRDFLARFMPPVLPVPGGFVINFVAAYKMIADMGKPSREELNERQLSAMREKWEGLISEEMGVPH